MSAENILNLDGNMEDFKDFLAIAVGVIFGFVIFFGGLKLLIYFTS